MGNQIGFEKTRPGVIPLLEGPDGNLVFEPVSGLRGGTTARSGFVLGTQEALSRAGGSSPATDVGPPRSDADVPAAARLPPAWVKTGSSVWHRYAWRLSRARPEPVVHVRDSGMGVDAG